MATKAAIVVGTAQKRRRCAYGGEATQRLVDREESCLTVVQVLKSVQKRPRYHTWKLEARQPPSKGTFFLTVRPVRVVIGISGVVADSGSSIGAVGRGNRVDLGAESDDSGDCGVLGDLDDLEIDDIG